MNENKMAVMPMKRLVLNMSIPLMLSLLIQSLYNIVDSMFVARVSEQALTAISLVYFIQFLMIAFGVGTNVGLNALLSRLVGQKKQEAACNAAGTELILNLVTAVFFSLVGVFFSRQIANALTNNKQLEELTQSYLSINMVWCYGIFLQTYGQRLLQAVGDTVLSMVSLISGAIVYMVLDPILIFGYFGCPVMGVRGAAIATVIGQVTGAIAALVLNRRKNPMIHVHWKAYAFSQKDVVSIYQVGLPTIVMQAIGSIMTFCINDILLSVSATDVAFFGIYYKLQSFLMMPMNGLVQAIIPIVGYNYGAGNHKRIEQAWKCMIPAELAFTFCGMFIFELFPSQLLSLFAAGKNMLQIGIPALRIIAPTFFFAIVTILCGYFASGLGNGIINMAGGALRQLVLLVPFLWIFTNYFGISYSWYAFWISESIACIYSFIQTKKLKQNLSF